MRSSRLAPAPRGPALAQCGEAALSQFERLLAVLVAALGPLLHWRDAALEAFEIGEHQFGLDRRDVGERVDAAFDMGDVVVLETAHDMRDRVAFADVGEKLVAEPLALRSAAHQPGDVDEGEARRNDLLRARDARQRLQPRVGHRDVADVRLDGAEGVVGRLRRGGLGQRVEERRLADVGQADDAAFEAHGGSARKSWGGSRGPMRGRAAKGKGGHLPSPARGRGPG